MNRDSARGEAVTRVADRVRRDRRVVLVTGGSGFIGSHLIERLHAEGAYVVSIDRRDPEGVRPDRFVKGAIEDPSTWRALALDADLGVDVLFHLAARTSVLESIKDPDDVFRSNMIGFHHALEFCRTRQVGRVVLASTNAVVGDAVGFSEIDESMRLAPLTPYGATKAADEMLAHAYSACYGVAVVAVRLTNVYGPSMWRKDSIVPRLFRHAMGLSDFAIYGSGEQFRDFVYVDDVVEAFLQLAAGRESGPVSFGSGTSITVNELVKLVSEVTGHALSPRHVPAKPGEMAGVRISLARAEALGLKAPTTLETGLRIAWEHFVLEHGQAAG
jgi:UDP-glucose 4-epimerase